jgi:Mrp family chromosome partitioning ATPase
MGLIEKAGGALDEALDEDRMPLADEAGAPASTLFDIDFQSMAAQGFYNPADRSSRLSLELRAIKRGLLRKTGFRNAAGANRMLKKGGRSRNLVLITSTRPGEGKTFCAINLALSLACEEKVDVLLVDADAPRPKVRAHFGLPKSQGLTDRLLNPALSVSALTMRARQAPLSILGEGTPVERPSELFATPDAQRLFTELSLRRANRLILIDAPPVLATSEAAVLARHADEILFVVEADSTPEAGVAAALDEILEANPNVSLVLNRCLIGEGGSYYGSYGDYDHQPPQHDGAS